MTETPANKEDPTVHEKMGTDRLEGNQASYPYPPGPSVK